MLLVFESHFRESLVASMIAIFSASNRLLLQIMFFDRLIFLMRRRANKFSSITWSLSALAWTIIRIRILIFQERICRRLLSLSSSSTSFIISNLLRQRLSWTLAFHFRKSLMLLLNWQKLLIWFFLSIVLLSLRLWSFSFRPWINWTCRFSSFFHWLVDLLNFKLLRSIMVVLVFWLRRTVILNWSYRFHLVN